MNALIPRPTTEVAPGAVHVPDWLTPDEQRALVAACRTWATGPVPIRHTKLPRRRHVRTDRIGWHWQPYRLGGPSRYVHHGVPRVRPGTADPACGLTTGRPSITMRVTGLGDEPGPRGGRAAAPGRARSGKR
ncbi:hypothetical protein [Kitasatospora xanthocidica]|uniref:hypothetical protein n=1 Tax=Kitasatospora xanthocidica TaxID=83382 RepID=UPI0016779F43|nr:hypothetical protein [Kitasatospora xanthocidica]